MKIKSLFLVAFFVSCSMNSANAKFQIKSSDIEINAMITNKFVFRGFGCLGENISPQISWSNAPIGTKSYALTVFDPDAPSGSGWWHYVAVNIPLTYSQFPTGFASENKFNLKDGINQVRNDFGIYNFGGPCPPIGHKIHHYVFTIHALKTDKINIPETATAALAGYMINQNSIDQTSFTALYKR